jgi:hypothetical protein
LLPRGSSQLDTARGSRAYKDSVDETYSARTLIVLPLKRKYLFRQKTIVIAASTSCAALGKGGGLSAAIITPSAEEKRPEHAARDMGE